MPFGLFRIDPSDNRAYTKESFEVVYPTDGITRFHQAFRVPGGANAVPMSPEEIKSSDAVRRAETKTPSATVKRETHKMCDETRLRLAAKTVPQAHEEGLENGDNAADIAADNMAATFAAKTSSLESSRSHAKPTTAQLPLVGIVCSTAYGRAVLTSCIFSSVENCVGAATLLTTAFFLAGARRPSA